MNEHRDPSEENKPTSSESTGQEAGTADGEGSDSSEFARMLAAFDTSREGEAPEVGAQVRGRIVLIGEQTSFVDFGGRSEGAIDSAYLRDSDGNLTVKAGDAVQLYVVENKDQVILAPSVKAEPSAALAQVLEARRTGMPLKGAITAVNAGGFEVDIAGLRGFCPVSQIESGFCESPEDYVGRTVEFLVTEVSDGGKRLVVSRKALLRRQEEERARETLATLKPGVEVEGTVSRLEGFGAFVDLGGVDGLVHISEISHQRIGSPGEALQIGQQVKVKVLDISEKKGRTRISLSMKAAAPDPWNEADEMFWAGKKVRGTVARMTDFGAFVSLSPGIDGLVHVSEIDLKPVAHPRDVLKVGQQVDAVVVKVESDRKRISLSIREYLAGDPEAAREAGLGVPAEPRNPTTGDLADGWVAGIKPYGLFVDLPAYGHRARGLLPREETGERSGSDLSRRFTIGDQLKVRIIDVGADGKIRLSLTQVQDNRRPDPPTSARTSGEATRSAPKTAMQEALERAMKDREAKGNS